MHPPKTQQTSNNNKKGTRRWSHATNYDRQENDWGIDLPIPTSSKTQPQLQTILRKQSPWNNQKPTTDVNDHGRSTALAQTLRRHGTKATRCYQSDETTARCSGLAMRPRIRWGTTVTHEQQWPGRITTRVSRYSHPTTSGTRPRSRITATAASKRARNRSILYRMAKCTQRSNRKRRTVPRQAAVSTLWLSRFQRTHV